MKLPCDINNCEKEGLHKTYTDVLVRFGNEEEPRDWIMRCDEHLTSYEGDWFSPAGFERGKNTHKVDVGIRNLFPLPLPGPFFDSVKPPGNLPEPPPPPAPPDEYD
jgi:hypothetical protein